MDKVMQNIINYIIVKVTVVQKNFNYKTNLVFLK